MVAQTSIDSIFGASQKIALTKATFLAYALPLAICLYIMGALVQLNGTRVYRLSLLPVLLWLTWRAIFIDFSGGNLRHAQMNAGIITQMCLLSMRATIWAFAQEPFRRRSPSYNNGESDPEGVYTVSWNAWDLIFNPRGVRWDWPQGFVPRPAFEMDSRLVFVLLSLGRLVLHAFALYVCVKTICILSPDTFGSLDGGPLFDHSLPFSLEFSRAIFVCFLTIWAVYFAIVWSYQSLAVVSIILFRQRPSQWPPLFDSPWLSTSLTELWGRRWHQMMRQVIVMFGVQPFNHLFGQLGGILGAFLVSGIVHDIEFRALGRGGNSVVVIGFWMMNGVGVVLEQIWKKRMGRRVGGVWGWMWTFGWLALWGVWMINEWAKAGRFASFRLPGERELEDALVGFTRRYLARRNQ